MLDMEQAYVGPDLKHKISKLAMLSLIISGLGNLATWLVLLWTYFTVPPLGVVEYLPLGLTALLLKVAYLLSVSIAIIAAVVNKTFSPDVKMALLISVLSYPLFLAGVYIVL